MEPGGIRAKRHSKGLTASAAMQSIDSQRSGESEDQHQPVNLSNLSNNPYNNLNQKIP